MANGVRNKCKICVEKEVQYMISIQEIVAFNSTQSTVDQEDPESNPDPGIQAAGTLAQIHYTVNKLFLTLNSSAGARV